MFLFSNNVDAYLITNKFLKNGALFGGVVYSSNSMQLQLIQNIFILNFAGTKNLETKDIVVEGQGRGGCFYLLLNDRRNASFIFHKNIFEGNQAVVGGVFYYHGVHLIRNLKYLFNEKANIYKNNKVRRLLVQLEGVDKGIFTTVKV